MDHLDGRYTRERISWSKFNGSILPVVAIGPCFVAAAAIKFTFKGTVYP